MRNNVFATGASLGERRAFLDGLSPLRFDIEPKSEEQLFGVLLTIRVPCGRLDL